MAGLIEPSIYRAWSDPLWSAFVTLLVWAGVRPLAGWVSAGSALCAALAVALVFSTARRIPLTRGRGVWRQEGDEGRARRWAGWASASALAAAPPVWMAATMPGPAALDLLLAAALMRGWVAAWTSHRAAPRRLFFAAWAASVWEHPPLAAAAPLLLIGGAFHTIRARLPWRETVRDWALAAAVFLLIGAAIVASAWPRPEWAWFEIETPKTLAGALASAMWREWKAAWPRAGWLLAGILYIAPMLFLFRENAQPSNRTERAIHLGILLLATGIAINAALGGPASPWRLTADRPLLLLPHLALALWWSHLFAQHLYAKQVRRRRGWWAPWAAAPVGLALCALWHIDESAAAASRRAMGRILAAAAHAAAPQSVWLAGARFDPALRVFARDARLDPLILNTALAEHPAYLRKLAAASNPEQARALVELGLAGTLFSELRRPGLDKEIAVFDVPAYWAALLRMQPAADAGWIRWRPRAASGPAPTRELDGAWRAYASAIPPARAWVPPAGPYRDGALALASYLRELAALQADAELAGRLDPLPARAGILRAATERASRRFADDVSARAAQEWARAEGLLRDGHKDAARAAFERLHKANPRLAPRALERLLLLDFLEQRWDDAEAHIRALASIAPGHSLLHWMRGHTLARRGRVDDAARAFRFSLELGETPLAHHALAALYSDARQWTRALPHAERAVALAPGHPAFLATRGTILSFLGRRTDALADFEQAMRAGGGTVPAIRLNLAALYLADGRAEDAGAVLSTLDPRALSEADRAHYEHVRGRFAD